MQRAGNLNRRVTFERRRSGTDEFGNVSNAWDYLMSVWADVRETVGREAVEAGRIEASRTATVRIRRSSDSLRLTADDRMLYSGDAWNIRSIADLGRENEMLDLLVEFGVAA